MSDSLIDAIKQAYAEMPGLCLTQRQVGRLWHTDPHTCDAALDHLVALMVLHRTRSGTYVLGPAHSPKPGLHPLVRDTERT
jgi:hypothetical protein